MKIAFFNSDNYVRKDQVWADVVGADHFNIGKLITDSWDGSIYDIAIVIIPPTSKESESFDRQQLTVNNYDLVERIQVFSNKVFVMLDGTYWNWQKDDVKNMIWYYKQIYGADAILCHNDIDVNYFKGLTGKPVHVLPTLMEENTVTKLNSDRVKKNRNEKVMVAGNWNTTENGFDAWIIGKEFKLPISGFKADKFKDDEDLSGINYLPPMGWDKFMINLSGYKYAVQCYHADDGWFSLNCAYLGIPCIGYNDTNTQRDLFPDLSVDRGDIVSARMLVYKLKDDKDFYQKCSSESFDRYEKMYSKKIFLEKWNKIIGELNG